MSSTSSRSEENGSLWPLVMVLMMSLWSWKLTSVWVSRGRRVLKPFARLTSVSLSSSSFFAFWSSKVEMDILVSPAWSATTSIKTSSLCWQSCTLPSLTVSLVRFTSSTGFQCYTMPSLPHGIVFLLCCLRRMSTITSLIVIHRSTKLVNYGSISTTQCFGSGSSWLSGMVLCAITSRLL